MKRAPLVILLVIVVLVGGGATWYFALGGKATLTDASAKGGPTPTATVSASEKEAADAAKALRRLTTNPESLVPDDQKGSVTTAEAVPKGSKIQVSQKSWAPASKSSGTLVATLSSPGVDDATYLVSMMKEDGRWVVVGTLPVAE